MNDPQVLEKNEQQQNWTEQFWQWSCQVYQVKEVATLCLAVQEELALNVNYLLLALWSGEQRIIIGQEIWQEMEQFCAEAEQAVLYIRQKRLALKDTSPDAYQQALLIELKAEQQHQKQIIQFLSKQNQKVSNETNDFYNLKSYLSHKAINAEYQDTVLQLAQLVHKIGF